MKIGVFSNPNKDVGNKVRDKVFSAARELGITAEPFAEADKYDFIVSVGGDGTIHEVVNGLFIQQTVRPDQVLLAVVAVGSGNDWVRTFGISNRYQDAVKAIAGGYSFCRMSGLSLMRRLISSKAVILLMSPVPGSMPMSSASSPTCKRKGTRAAGVIRGA